MYYSSHTGRSLLYRGIYLMTTIKQGLTFDDVLLEPNYTGSASRANVSTTTKLKSSKARFDFKSPLISANMDTVTGAAMAKKMGELGGLGILHRFCSIDENVEMFKAASNGGHRVGVSVGVSDAEKDRLGALVESGAELVCVDVAHGHAKHTGNMIKHIRDTYDDKVFIIAGNVATYAGADYLSGCGADAIKVGIGPGSACSTRIKTGCGVPQLTAIMECRRVKCSIIADGGIRKPADFVKALAAGADMVMVGGMFAGTKETPGDVKRNSDGEDVKTYRGLASKEAQEDFMGQVGRRKRSES